MYETPRVVDLGFITQHTFSSAWHSDGEGWADPQFEDMSCWNGGSGNDNHVPMPGDWSWGNWRRRRRRPSGW